MDEIARHNKERWEELAGRGVGFSRPYLDLQLESARQTVDAQGILGDVSGKDVLCLASGGGYPLKQPYVDGGELVFQDPCWEIWNDGGSNQRIKGPREFRHTLSTIVNTLVRLGFIILGAWEETMRAPDARPGSWDHFTSIAPPYLTFWAAYCPDVFTELTLPDKNNSS